MNLQYLHSFYITVKANSISKAAKLLFLTQPGLSMQLQALEKELDASLLIRSNKGVELTKEGQVVFDYADKILALKDNIERDLDALKFERTDLLISSCRFLGDYALPCTLYIYKHKFSDVAIDLKICNSEQVISNLLDHSSNIGLVSMHFQHPELILEKILESPIMLVSATKPAKNKISIDELQQLPLILLEDGSGSRKAICNALGELDTCMDCLNIVFEANSCDAIKSSVLSGKGYTFFPAFVIEKELQRNMLYPIEIEGFSASLPFYVARRKDYVLLDFEKKFTDLLLSNKRGFC